MRLFLLLLSLLPAQAHAWTFRADPICTLDHADLALQVQVTFDPATGLYAIALDRPQGWPPAPVFSITFGDERGLTISTSRHRVDGTVLTVTDRGFGNVLAGLEGHDRAIARLGPTEAPFSLKGARPAVAQFRDCPSPGLA